MSHSRATLLSGIIVGLGLVQDKLTLRGEREAHTDFVLYGAWDTRWELGVCDVSGVSHTKTMIAVQDLAPKAGDVVCIVATTVHRRDSWL